MDQKAPRVVRAQRGRPPAFDADRVIDGAVDLFWSLGFDGTSLQDIADALDIRSSTLYNSFGGKDGLYRSAVESYLASTDAMMFAPLRDGDGGLDDLVSLLERQRASLTHPHRPAGCLIVNAMVTGDNPALARQYRNRFRGAIDCALDRAVELGEIEPADGPLIGAALFGGVLGANVAAKSGASRTELNAIVDGLIHGIASSAGAASG